MLLLRRCKKRSAFSFCLPLHPLPYLCWPPSGPLPPLQDTLLDFSPMHATSYNLFVDILRFNMLTSDW